MWEETAQCHLEASGNSVFLGRPSGQKVEINPNCKAAWACHAASPNGCPRLTQRRSAWSVSCGKGSLTQYTHASGGVMGHGCNTSWGRVLCCSRCQRLPYRQCSAWGTNPACTGFRST